MAQDRKTAFVVLDLVMDGMDGFEVLATLRRDSKTKQLPVVVHTSKFLENEDYERLASAIDIIPKSIMSSRDLAVLRFSQALQKAGLTNEIPSGQPVSTP